MIASGKLRAFSDVRVAFDGRLPFAPNARALNDRLIEQVT